MKGANRLDFELRLVANMQWAMRDLPQRHISRTFGRIFVPVDGDGPEVVERLARVCGIVSLSLARRAPLDIEAILAVSLDLARENIRPGETFKVETRRANKKFPLTSPEVSRLGGAHILGHMPEVTVDVQQPQRTVHIEIRDQEAYIYVDSVSGPGGLPVGSSGRGLLLLSGGIDSPVAGYLAMRRGVRVTALHFHSFPFTSERSREKVVDLCRRLSLYGGPVSLYVAYFTEIQKAVRQNCPEELYVTIMRRMMFRLAEHWARETGCLAVFTGENLGQVASQTMESIAVIGEVCRLPILRPLIGMDKADIIAWARRIGTYEISIRPYEDCCTLFVPRHPATKPKLAKVVESEASLDIQALLAESMARTEVVRVGGDEDTGREDTGASPLYKATWTEQENREDQGDSGLDRPGPRVLE